MLQSKNKQKIYFYLFILLFLTTSFNFSLIKNINEFSKLKIIDINGLNKIDHNALEQELKILLSKNIFLIKENEILELIENFKFIDKIFIKKILPSKLKISAQKTKFMGITFIDGIKYFIGKNEKLIPYNKIDDNSNLPLIFGNFPISEFLILNNIFEKNKFEINKIKKYYYHKSKRWDIELKDGLLIKLPSKNITKALKIYKIFMLNKKTNIKNKTRIIDLRIPNQVVISHDKK